MTGIFLLTSKQSAIWSDEDYRFGFCSSVIRQSLSWLGKLDNCNVLELLQLGLLMITQGVTNVLQEERVAV